MSDTLYKEYILDHYKNPRNNRVLPGFTHKFALKNESCGDEIEVYVKISEGVIEDASFESRGCAISIASASILMEKVKGMTVDELGAFPEDEMLKLIGMERTSGRVKCALLPLDALKGGIKV